MQFSTVIQNQNTTNVEQIQTNPHMSRSHERNWIAQRQVSGMNLFDDSFTELNCSERLLNQHIIIWGDIRYKLLLFSEISYWNDASSMVN